MPDCAVLIFIMPLMLLIRGWYKIIGRTKRQILSELSEKSSYGYKISLKLSIPLSTVYDHLNSLHKSGFVDRHDAEHSRQIYYTITQKGKYLLIAIE